MNRRKFSRSNGLDVRVERVMKPCVREVKVLPVMDYQLMLADELGVMPSSLSDAKVEAYKYTLCEDAYGAK